MRLRGALRLAGTALVLTFPSILGVDHSKFKSCSQAGFCRRLRSLATASPLHSPYSLHSPVSTGSGVAFDVSNAVAPDVRFALKVDVLKNGAARVGMDEVGGLRQRYNETAAWVLQNPQATALEDPEEVEVVFGDNETKLRWRQGKEVRITHHPLRIAFSRDGVEQVVLNERNLVHMEHFRLKTIGGEHEDEGEQLVLAENEDAFDTFRNEDGMWEETYGGKQDPKPKGPESLSVDIDFPGYAHVYGIPEHASPLSLKTTRGGEGAYEEPYRLYNLDVFEYEPDSPMALYGSVPFLLAHRPHSTVGVLLLTASETWVDVTRTSSSTPTTQTHWMAESGTLDLLVFLGPEHPLGEYTDLTGRVPLPQWFAMAYHQCRWNYQSEEDVLDVVTKFDAHDIPLDVMWLDIEYAHEHEYFIWDQRYFPHPEKMQESLAEKGRKLVAIVDPHIKRDPSLYIYTEAQELDILSKTADGKEFEGWCWTGSSAWTDWFNPRSWAWWVGQFRLEKFKGSTKDLFIWNDMNEPSIFNGPEITMQKDAVHYGGWEHRDVHNVGGMIYQNVTAQGLISRLDVPERPFVLTRAYFAGSQRFGAHWTGDNLGTWAHLKGAVPMFLTSGIAGLPFVGADVGGFFGNPSGEMMVRWYQVGSVSPFFRAHGHIDTKRREPYLYPEPIRGYLRQAIRFRYSVLPALYTAFWEAGKTGLPILRPQFLVFPDDPKGFAIDDQFYFGSTGLLVKPVVSEGATSTDIYISDQQPYYHYDTGDMYFGAQVGGTTVTVPAPLDSLPILHRGGSILPRRDLIRRASTLSWKDPFTLVITADRTASAASGSLYLDDGATFAHERGEWVHRTFELKPDFRGKKSLVLASKAVVEEGYDVDNEWSKKISDVKVRRVVVLGLAQPPSCIRKNVRDSVGLEFTWTPGVAGSAARRAGGTGKQASKLVIHDADQSLIKDWELRLDIDGTPCDVLPAPQDFTLALQSPACPAGHFQCANKGHTAGCILVSRVNDGVCDPECCDGSDETDGKVDCPNRCVEIGALERKKAQEEDRKRRVGAALRKEYVAFGVKEKRKLEVELDRTERGLDALRSKEADAKEQLEALETAEAGEIERKKSSVLYEKLVAMQGAIKSLRTHRTNLEAHVTELSGILADLSRDFNPNYQDMAVLGASRAFKDWKTSNGFLDEVEEDLSEEELGKMPASPTPAAAETTDLTDAELEALENEDPLSLIDGLSMRVSHPIPSKFNIFKVEDYLPDAWRPKFQDYRKTLIELLAKTGIIPASVPSSESDRPELARARSAHTKIAEEVEQTQTKRDETRKLLERDWGRDWEWKKLDGTCIEKDTGEYTYILCFFGEAYQKANVNQGKTNLGKFSTWSTTAEPGTDEYYTKHVYENGQRCWNGPARSAKVDFQCGTTNALLSVVEPEKCEYLFTVTTPAICYPPTEAGKDEL